MGSTVMRQRREIDIVTGNAGESIFLPVLLCLFDPFRRTSNKIPPDVTWGFGSRKETHGTRRKIERIPLLASAQGGVAERLIKCREASADREAGMVFRLRTQRKTTPAASASLEAARYRACASRASQNFPDDAATPPCGDARRGITHQRNSFTPS